MVLSSIEGGKGILGGRNSGGTTSEEKGLSFLGGIREYSLEKHCMQSAFPEKQKREYVAIVIP